MKKNLYHVLAIGLISAGLAFTGGMVYNELSDRNSEFYANQYDMRCPYTYDGHHDLYEDSFYGGDFKYCENCGNVYITEEIYYDILDTVEADTYSRTMNALF